MYQKRPPSCRVLLLPGSSKRNPLRDKVLWFVQQPKFQYFMLIVITINAIMLACDYYQAPDALKDAIKYVNLTCTIIFVIECVLKLFGFGIRKYFSELANWLDFLLVACHTWCMLLDVVISRPCPSECYWCFVVLWVKGKNKAHKSTGAKSLVFPEFLLLALARMWSWKSTVVSG